MVRRRLVCCGPAGVEGTVWFGSARPVAAGKDRLVQVR